MQVLTAYIVSRSCYEGGKLFLFFLLWGGGFRANGPLKTFLS